MATYSVYNIKIDNQLSFTPGATAGYVLAIDANGNTYWSAGGAGGSGSSGTSGSSGSSGTSGSSGSSGTSGKSGSSGTSGSSPAQTLAQTLALGNSVGTYSITSPTNQTLDIVSGANAGVRIGNISNGNYIGVGIGSTIMGATTSFNSDVLLPILSSLLATDGSGRIIATASTGGGSGSSGTSGINGSSGTSGVSGPGSFGITIDGAGSVITTGLKGYITIPYSGTITGWTILADVSGSIVIDVWKDNYAAFPPSVADTIAGSEKPTLSSAIKNEDNALSTWTTSVTAGDIIAFNVDSVSTITRVNLAIKITKS